MQHYLGGIVKDRHVVVIAFHYSTVPTRTQGLVVCLETDAKPGIDSFSVYLIMQLVIRLSRSCCEQQEG
jgi:hypothetical protein